MGTHFVSRLTLHLPTDWGWKFCNEQYYGVNYHQRWKHVWNLPCVNARRAVLGADVVVRKQNLSAHYCVDVKEVVGRQTRCW